MPSYLEIIGIIHIIYIIIGSIASLVLYKKDKRLAMENKERIKERTLLLTAIFGGGIASLVARIIFHHKTNKPYFSLVIYISVIFEILVVALYLYILMKGSL